MTGRTRLATAREQATLGSAFAALGDGLLVLDEDHRVELLNGPGEELLGTDAARAVGRRIDDLAAEWNLRDRGPFAVSKMRHHLVRGLSYRNDDAFVVGQGRICYVSLVMTPIQQGDQNLGAVICLRDITNLKLGEARLLENEERLRRVFQGAPVGMIRLSAGSIIADCNDAFERMLGYEAGALIGPDAPLVWFPEDVAVSRKLVNDILRGTRPNWHGDARFRHVDGSPVWATAAVARVAGVGLDEAFAVAVVEDATERRRLEVELRHAQKLESVGRLAAGIAHEINTPVQFIGDNVRFLGGAFDSLAAAAVPQGAPTAPDQDDLDFLRTEIPEAVRETLDGVERVATIVQAMKSFGHPGGGEPTAVDVNEVVSTTLVVAASELRPVATVETEYGDVPTVQAWRNDLNQVVLNLLVNAAHAIGDHLGDGQLGVIRVATRVSGEAVEIAVTDTGGGIPDDIRDRIFDPFFTTKDVGRGTGQGLALAHNVVVDRHGGELTFETEAGVGTTFRVRLPRG